MAQRGHIAPAGNNMNNDGQTLRSGQTGNSLVVNFPSSTLSRRSTSDSDSSGVQSIGSNHPESFVQNLGGVFALTPSITDDTDANGANEDGLRDAQPPRAPGAGSETTTTNPNNNTANTAVAPLPNNSNNSQGVKRKHSLVDTAAGANDDLDTELDGLHKKTKLEEETQASASTSAPIPVNGTGHGRGPDMASTRGRSRHRDPGPSVKTRAAVHRVNIMLSGTTGITAAAETPTPTGINETPGMPGATGTAGAATITIAINGREGEREVGEGEIVEDQENEQEEKEA